jgi:hypothetical protein
VRKEQCAGAQGRRLLGDPAWAAGVFQILPVLGVLVLLGALCDLYLYLGLPQLMKCPPDKAVGYVSLSSAASWLASCCAAASMFGFRRSVAHVQFCSRLESCWSTVESIPIVHSAAPTA